MTITRGLTTKLLCVLSLLVACAIGQDIQPVKVGPSKETASGLVSVSGTPVFFADGNGSVSNSFELVVNGGPASLTVNIFGCGSGGTCGTVALASSSGTTSQILAATGPYPRYKVVASWTGGTAPNVVINRYATTAGKSGGGSLPFVGAPTGACGPATTATDTSSGNFYSCNNGVWLLAGPGAAGSAAFNTLTGGTNAGQALLVGNSSTLSTTGTGTITANAYNGANNLANSNLAPMNANTLKGNNTGSASQPFDLTAAQVKSFLAIVAADVGGLATVATSGSAADLSGTLAAAQLPPQAARTANPLSQFAATSSAQLLALLSTKTGTGLSVFGTSPSMSGVTLNDITGSTQCLHVNSSGVISGTGADCPSGAGSGNVSGPVSSVIGHFALYGNLLGTQITDGGAPAAIATSGSASDLIAGTVGSARLPLPYTSVANGKTGQVFNANNGAAGSFASPAVVITTIAGTTDSILCDSGTTLVDRLTVRNYTANGAIAVSLPSVAASGCGTGFAFGAMVSGTGSVVTMTPTTSRITYCSGFSCSSGLSSLVLRKGANCSFRSDTTDYFVSCNGIDSVPYGNIAGGTNNKVLKSTTTGPADSLTSDDGNSTQLGNVTHAVTVAADICATYINPNLQAGLGATKSNGPIVDLATYTGASLLHCGSDPFVNFNTINGTGGEIDIGGQSISTDVPWILPNKFKIKGINKGDSGSNGTNSSIVASSTFHTNYPPIIGTSGQTLCVNPGGGSPTNITIVMGINNGGTCQTGGTGTFAPVGPISMIDYVVFISPAGTVPDPTNTIALGSIKSVTDSQHAVVYRQFQAPITLPTSSTGYQYAFIMPVVQVGIKFPGCAGVAGSCIANQEKVEDVGIDPADALNNTADRHIAAFNMYGQENVWFQRIGGRNANWTCVDIESTGAQNSGPYLDNNCGGNSLPDSVTQKIIQTGYLRFMEGGTQTGGATNFANILLVNTINGGGTTMINPHLETATNGLQCGWFDGTSPWPALGGGFPWAPNGEGCANATFIGFSGNNVMTNLFQFANVATTTGIWEHGSVRGGATHLIQDNIHGVTLNSSPNGFSIGAPMYEDGLDADLFQGLTNIDDVNFVGGQDAAAATGLTLGGGIFRGADATGSGSAATVAGGATVRGGNNAVPAAGSEAGSVQVLAGQSTNATQGKQGLIMLEASYVKGATVTQWNLQQESAAMTTADAAATPQQILGVAELVNTNTVQVVFDGLVPINASATTGVGHTVCAASVAGQVTDSGGSNQCPAGQITVGTVMAVTGTWHLKDGATFTATTTLPLVQLTAKAARVFVPTDNYLGLVNTDTVTYQGGIDASNATGLTLGPVIVRGADTTGTGNGTSAAGGTTVRGGDNAIPSTVASQAGSVILRPGQSTGATQGLQGLLALQASYVKGATVTPWNLECVSGSMTVTDCSASPLTVVGVAQKVLTNTALVTHTGQTPINASAAVTLGDTVCAGSSAGLVTDAGGTGGCTAAQGTAVGTVIAVAGAWTLPDGTAVTASTTLPIVQLKSSLALSTNLVTASSTLTNHGVALGKGTRDIGSTAAGAIDTVLAGQGASADPIFLALSGTGTQQASTYSVSGHAFGTIDVCGVVPFYQSGGVATSIAAPTANATKIWGFMPLCDVNGATAITYSVTGLDNNSGAGHNYGIAILNSAGTILQTSGALPGTTFTGAALGTKQLTSLTSTNFVAGTKYYFIYTTDCASACAAIGGNSQGSFLVGGAGAASTGGTPTGGTPPADSYNLGNFPGFILH